MNNKHSRLPWKTMKGMAGGKVHFGYEYDHDEISLGSCCYQGPRPYDSHLREEEEANAAFIVKACNNHEKLLNSCKLALMAFENNAAIDWSEIERAIKAAEKDQ